MSMFSPFPKTPFLSSLSLENDGHDVYRSIDPSLMGHSYSQLPEAIAWQDRYGTAKSTTLFDSAHCHQPLSPLVATAPVISQPSHLKLPDAEFSSSWISTLPCTQDFPTTWMLCELTTVDNGIDLWTDKHGKNMWKNIMTKLHQLSSTSCESIDNGVSFTIQLDSIENTCYSDNESLPPIEIQMQACDALHIRRAQVTLYLGRTGNSNATMIGNLCLLTGSISGDRGVYHQLRSLLQRDLLAQSTANIHVSNRPMTALPLLLPEMDINHEEIAKQTNATIDTLLDMSESHQLDLQLEGLRSLAEWIKGATYTYWTQQTSNRFHKSMLSTSVTWRGHEECAHLASRILHISAHNVNQLSCRRDDTSSTAR